MIPLILTNKYNISGSLVRGLPSPPYPANKNRFSLERHWSYLEGVEVIELLDANGCLRHNQLRVKLALSSPQQLSEK